MYRCARTYDEKHPTCISCIRQGIGCVLSKAKKAKPVEVIKTWHEGKVLHTTAYLYSVNHWHCKGRHVYLKEKKKWLEVFRGTWALWGKQGSEKRNVIIHRYVKHENQIIADDDNKWASLKPAIDGLKAAGVITDDSREYINLSIEQKVVGRCEILVEVYP